MQVKHNDLKGNLNENKLLLHVDFSENYKTKQQNLIQSVYFGVICCY